MVRASPSRTSTSGSQPSSVRASVMSGLRTEGSSVGRSMNSMRRVGAGDLADQLGELQHGQLVRVADVHRPAQVREQQPDRPVDQVVDVADRAGLAAVAGHGDRLAGQRLAHERRDRAAVVGPHPRAVGVEDPHDRGVHAVVGAVGGGDRLGEPLGLVVAGPRADRVDVAPVTLVLRVHLRVAVGLRGGGEQEARALLLGQPEAVQGADGADLQGLDRQLGVVDRGGGRGEVQNVVDRSRHHDVIGDVGAQQPEAVPPLQVLRRCPGIPVRKLSRHSTSMFSSSSRSARCEPTKPAPPVITARWRIATYSVSARGHRSETRAE